MKFENYKIGYALLSIVLSAYTSTSVAMNDMGEFDVGGYIKLDTRLVSGDVAYSDYWIGKAQALETQVDTFKMSAKESRVNIGYERNDLYGTLRMDFYGKGGNEVVSNSYQPRIRELYFTYKNLLFGQTWSNAINPYAYPEAVSFGGPMNGEVFARQPQIRVSYKGLSVAMENPKATGDADADDGLPDLTIRYQWDSDVGHLSVAALGSKLSGDEIDETATAVFLAGRIHLGLKMDVRFQYNTGHSGRYVSPGLTDFLVMGELESVDAYVMGAQYRASDSVRTNIYIGHSEAEIQKRETSHAAANVFYDLDAGFTVAGEVGRYELKHQKKRSNYFQLAFILPH